MLLDLVFAIAMAAAGAVVTATLSFTLAATVRGRLTAAAAIAAWFCGVLFLGATGALNVEGIGAPGLGLAVLAPTIVLSWLVLKAAQTVGPAAPPMPVLIAVHAVRVLGIAFVLLYAGGRLPAPFAPTAGWGDIAIGLTSVPVALLAYRPGGRALALVWNALGCLDLITAVSLGALSSPGPARLFLAPPGSAIMTSLPWILIPAFLVPGLFALHVAIFARLRRSEAETGALALAGRA